MAAKLVKPALFLTTTLLIGVVSLPVFACLPDIETHCIHEKVEQNWMECVTVETEGMLVSNLGSMCLFLATVKNDCSEAVALGFYCPDHQRRDVCPEDRVLEPGESVELDLGETTVNREFNEVTMAVWFLEERPSVEGDGEEEAEELVIDESTAAVTFERTVQRDREFVEPELEGGEEAQSEESCSPVGCSAASGGGASGPVWALLFGVFFWFRRRRR